MLRMVGEATSFMVPTSSKHSDNRVSLSAKASFSVWVAP